MKRYVLKCQNNQESLPFEAKSKTVECKAINKDTYEVIETSTVIQASRSEVAHQQTCYCKLSLI